eukprot:TRINITY_DN1648_c0_g1_i1.p1 TRINITY_DN1648_c0_g1~~TRINITY_DN1648_c0_g1_i1.p1  ORF type:complete len:622 (+),score=80.27 TRINITY_DN1648_c0_g1_i1:421-2286(+)
MDVVDVNFITALSILREHLPSADFVSFDLEFTGLGKYRPSQLDTPQVRYNTAREDASAFPPIQFGLCLFRHSRPLTSRAEPDCTVAEKCWETLSFNFNLFPRAVYYPPGSRYPLFDKKFKLQSSTVMFLIEHGFDFQKSFRNGITWLRKDQETELFKVVLDDLRMRRTRTCDLHQLNAEEGMLVKEWTENIEQWFESLKEQSDESGMEDATPKVRSFLLPSTPWMRKIILDLVRLRYSRVAAQTIPTQDGQKMMKLSLYSSEKAAMAHYEKALEKDARDITFRASMFRHVVDELQIHKKPIVVHNGLMDLTKLYGNFVGTLPSELNGFKNELRKCFPVVYDTKRMVDRLCVQDEEVRRGMVKTHGVTEILGKLRKIAKKRHIKVDTKTFIPQDSNGEQFATKDMVYTTDFNGFATKVMTNAVMDRDSFGFGRYLSESVEHEAGYDALETGLLFTYLDVLGERTPNELSLGFCGGFRFIDVSSGKDEENLWFDLPVIIVNGVVDTDVANGERNRNERGKAKFIHTIEVLVKDTNFQAEQTDILLASKDVCIAILNTKSTGKRKREDVDETGRGADMTSVGSLSERIEMVIENGKRQGVEVMRYSRDVLGKDWQWLSRTRMFA